MSQYFAFSARNIFAVHNAQKEKHILRFAALLSKRARDVVL